VRADRLDLAELNWKAYIDHYTSPCPYDGLMVRVFSFSLERPMQEHWNTTVNKPIRDNKQFDRELRRMSDQASEYAGIEQRYERIDPEDTQALGITAEGLDATNRVRVAQGQPPINIDAL
jgi:hypothetical protein